MIWQLVVCVSVIGCVHSAALSGQVVKYPDVDLTRLFAQAKDDGKVVLKPKISDDLPMHQPAHAEPAPSGDEAASFNDTAVDTGGEEYINYTNSSPQKCTDIGMDICRLPNITGPCRAYFKRWYHVNGVCEEFIYGGCQGNENNFETKEDCEEACVGNIPGSDCDGTGPTCIRSCDGLPHGDYQSCDTCTGFVKCDGQGWHDWPCAPVPVTVWDDELQRCEWVSTTCELCFRKPEVTTYEFDFRNDSLPEPDGERFQWLVSPTEGDAACSSKGVLQINPAECVTAVSIRMEVEEWKYFNFHVAGTKDNDGYGQYIFKSAFGGNDSEIHNFNNGVYAFTDSDAGLLPFGDMLPDPENGNAVVCITIMKGKVYLSSSGARTLDVTLNDPGLFDSLTDIFIGFNRVIAEDRIDVPGATGEGLCAAAVSWKC